MIAVLMRDQNGGQIRDIFAYRGEPFGDFAPAEPCVDENPSSLGSHESRIARAAAGQNANLDDGSAPSRKNEADSRSPRPVLIVYNRLPNNCLEIVSALASFLQW